MARRAIAERDACVVMEGYADCIMAHQFGITNAVATLGTALTENHVAVLKRFTRKVVLVFDGDQAGREAAEKSLPRFLSQDVDLRILTLTTEKDPADFLMAQRRRSLRPAARFGSGGLGIQATLEYRATRLDSVDAREQVVAEMLELFRQSPRFGGSARENIVLNRLAFRVGLSESRIREMLVDKSTKANDGDVGRAKTRRRRRYQSPDATSGATQVEPTRPRPSWSASCSRCVLSDPTAVDVLQVKS